MAGAEMLWLLILWQGGASPELATVVYGLLPFSDRLPLDPPPVAEGWWLGVEAFYLPVPFIQAAIPGGGLSFLFLDQSAKSRLELSGTVDEGWLTFVDYTGQRRWFGGTALRGVFRFSWLSADDARAPSEIGAGIGMTWQPLPEAYTPTITVFPWFPYGEVFVGGGLPDRFWVRSGLSLGGVNLSMTVRWTEGWVVGGSMLWAWPGRPYGGWLAFRTGLWKNVLLRR